MGSPFSDPFRPPTELAATAFSLAVVNDGIRERQVIPKPNCPFNRCAYPFSFATYRFPRATSRGE